MHAWRLASLRSSRTLGGMADLTWRNLSTRNFRDFVGDNGEAVSRDPLLLSVSEPI